MVVLRKVLENSSILAVIALATIGVGSTAYAQESQAPWYDRISVEFGITNIVQGTVGNDDKGSSDQVDYSFSADLALAGEIAEGHTINLIFEAGEGEAAGDNFPRRATPNYDAKVTTNGPDVMATLAQAYYEGEFFDGALIVSAGKMDVHSLTDTNEYANDETEQFMNGIFVRSVGVVFAEHEKYYVPTIFITLRPIEFLSFTYTYSHDGGEDILTDGHHWAEIGIHPRFGELAGNYRFSYAKHDLKHTDINNGTKKANTGMINVSIDQAITPGIGLFFRYAQQDDGLVENEVKSAISGGASVNGALWNRGEDTFGIAYGKVELNDKLIKQDNEGESVVEAYYKAGLNEYISLTADVQVFNNLERPSKRDVTVYGIRAQAGF